MNLTPGKTVGSRIYLHIDAASALDAVWTERWRAAERIAGLQRGAHYNLIRLDAEGPAIALLALPRVLRRTVPRPAGRLARRPGPPDRQLPHLLRVYVGGAAVLYGDYRQADLVKIHIASGKLSLLRFDDFTGQPLPRLLERVKIKLREQHIDVFTYGDRHEPPFLYHKSRAINEEFPHYPEQLAFEAALEGLDLFDLSGYGPPPAELRETLARHRWTIDGFTLGRSTSIPDLDDPCGAYLTFRQMIECGETQARTGLANRPQQPDSYTALLDLALNVLDPAIDYFGMIRLTYGFCSPALAREIPGRIDPKRDQHAAHELNRRGQPVCARRGAAVDFLIEDENMLEVAQWIVARTPFDRLYFYGPEQPLHVSFGPNHDREIVCMVATPAGRRVPRVLARESFLAMVAL
jgi:hypothetical protein